MKLVHKLCFSLVSQLSFNLCVALRIPKTVWSHSPAFVSWCNWRPLGKMVSVGINGNVYNDINFLRPPSTPWFTKFKQARAKLGGLNGTKTTRTAVLFSRLQCSLARASRRLSQLFPPSPRKTKHTASTQADRTATTVVPKKTGGIGIVMWRLFFKLKISLVT